MSEEAGLARGVRQFFAGCPLLPAGGVGLDYLGLRPPAAAVEAAGADLRADAPVLRRYLDGGSLRQFPFRLSILGAHGADTRENLRGRALLEEVARWVERQDGAGRLPQVGADREPLRLLVTGQPELSQQGAGSARLGLRMRLIYYEAGAGRRGHCAP